MAALAAHPSAVAQMLLVAHHFHPPLPLGILVAAGSAADSVAGPAAGPIADPVVDPVAGPIDDPVVEAVVDLAAGLAAAVDPAAELLVGRAIEYHVGVGVEGGHSLPAGCLPCDTVAFVQTVSTVVAFDVLVAAVACGGFATFQTGSRAQDTVDVPTPLDDVGIVELIPISLSTIVLVWRATLMFHYSSR